MSGAEFTNPEYVDLVVQASMVIRYSGEPIDGIPFTSDPEEIISASEALKLLKEKGYEVIRDYQESHGEKNLVRYIRLRAKFVP